MIINIIPRNNSAIQKKDSTSFKLANDSIRYVDVVYVVQKNDNLTKIAYENGTTWQKIYDINKINNKKVIVDPNLIYPWQELLLPDKAKLKFEK